MKNINPYFGYIIAISFLIMSFYLTQKESTFAKIAGYIGIVWWGGLFLFAFYKKLTSKNNN